MNTDVKSSADGLDFLIRLLFKPPLPITFDKYTTTEIKPITPKSAGVSSRANMMVIINWLP